MTPHADQAALIRAAQAGDDGACERLFSENTGLIWSVVRRYFGRGVDPDDLYQLGCIGFLKAVRGFDPSFATQFSTYAVPKIAGEVRRFLRDDGPIKVSRGAKEKAIRVKQAREALCQQLGREPALSELAGQCGLSAEEIASVELAVAPPESFQRESREDGPAPEDLVGVEGLEDEVIRRVALRESIDQLPPRERAVILLRYFKGLTQEKTARVMGVSQVQISRLERRAVDGLRAYWV
ncbi:MAG: sigma-70 family RNA polymerase sigma factor [Oscillospiraceae bacterium]|nr:sigma-70 family RNA polymerase sigma factor [Oscillospiraceae bacterium]